jgi:hypothetical protein
MMKAKPVPTPSLSDAERTPPRLVVGAAATAPCPPAKTSGIKVRGTGAATKGTMARGPMA